MFPDRWFDTLQANRGRGRGRGKGKGKLSSGLILLQTQPRGLALHLCILHEAEEGKDVSWGLDVRCKMLDVRCLILYSV